MINIATEAFDYREEREWGRIRQIAFVSLMLMIKFSSWEAQRGEKHWKRCGMGSDRNLSGNK